jgi:histidinol-phosphate/aromatic aminotransferase/cobyric acid decarboxylase-like protein
MDRYQEEIQPLVRIICSERDRLFVELGSIQGLEPVNSLANFMVVRSRIPPTQVFNELLEHDILIRDVSGYPMLSDYFRISVGTPDEDDRLIKALRELFE